MTHPTSHLGRSRTPTASYRGRATSSSRPWSPPAKPGNTPDHGASKPLIRRTGTKTLKPSPAAAVPRSTRSSDDIPSPRERARLGNQGRLRVWLGGACGGRLRSAGHPPDPLRESQGKLHGTVAVRARQCAGTAGPLPAPASQTLAAAEFASSINDDSSIASNCAAGIAFSSLNRLSGQAASSVPLKNQLLPLSARINP